MDPFGEYSDDQLWDTLEKVHLKETISELPNKLDNDVVENGENFR